MTLTTEQIQELQDRVKASISDWRRITLHGVDSEVLSLTAELHEIAETIPALCTDLLAARAENGNERRQLSEIAKACNYVTTYNKGLPERVAELAALPDEIQRLRAEVARLREALGALSGATGITELCGLASEGMHDTADIDLPNTVISGRLVKQLAAILARTAMEDGK